MAHRLPMFHDDLSFHDRHEGAFRDMQRRLDDDLLSSGFGRNRDWPGMGGQWNWEDDLDRLSRDFHQLKPRSSRVNDLKRDDFGSRESLDDNSSNNVYIEHPQTKSRTFHMSFDVKDYDPKDISVKADGDSMVVEARHEEEGSGGHKNIREFSRRIRIPPDVDPDKLTSTISNDGILTIQAPVPPKYTSVAYINPEVNQEHNGNTYGIGYQKESQHAPSYRPSPPVESTGYQYSKPLAPETQQYQQQPATRNQYRPQESQARPSPPPMQAPPAPVSKPSADIQTNNIAETPSLKSPPPLFEPAFPPPMPLDDAIFTTTEDGTREMELAVEIPRPFGPEDVVVKLEGGQLIVEGVHEDKVKGKSSKSSMSRSFDLSEPVDPGSVEAMLRSDGCLLIKGKAMKKT